MVNKFGAVKTEFAGRVFDSASEAKRAAELMLLAGAGRIADLSFQPVLDLVVNGKKIGRVTGDFSYLEDGKLVFEDRKSAITAKQEAFRLRWKLAQALHPTITFRITGKGIAA